MYGLKASLAWGCIYALCGLALFGILYSNFIRRCGAQTLPEFLEMRFDGRTRSVVAITSVIGMPPEDAIKYMKEAATHSYLSKGQDIVEMNHRAIDLGATAFVEFKVPESWKDAKDNTEPTKLEGCEKTVEMVEKMMLPIDRMDGDSLPVSAFVDHGFLRCKKAAPRRRNAAC